MNQSIEEALNENRLIVLMEQDDGKFRQVLVNAKQFKAISDNTGVKVTDHDEDLKPNYEIFNTFFKEDFELDGDLFIGCESITPDAYFE